VALTTLLTEIKARIEATLVANGISGYTVTRGEMPNSPNKVITVQRYAGKPPMVHFGSAGLHYEHPKLQVVVRGDPTDFDGPMAVMNTIYRDLVKVQDTLLTSSLSSTSGIRMLMLMATQHPSLSARDGNQRCVWSCDFAAEVEYALEAARVGTLGGSFGSMTLAGLGQGVGIDDQLVGYWALESNLATAMVSEVNSPAMDVPVWPGSAATTTAGKNNLGIARSLYYYTSTGTSSSPVNATGVWTMNAWIRITSPQIVNTWPIFPAYSAGYASGCDIRLSNAAGYPAGMWHHGTGGAKSTIIETPVGTSPGNWYMVTAGADPATGVRWVVLNADFSSSYTVDTYDGTLSNPFAVNTWFLDPYGASQGWDVWDELGLWFRTLEQAEVTELYAAGAGKFYPF
jgi:hypothetical protein